MERRGMSWRTIPPELAVPTMMAVLLGVIELAVPADRSRGTLSDATALTRDILIAYGLLVLRRRAAGRASPLLAVGAALQGVAAAATLASGVTSVAFAGAWTSVSGTLSYVSSGATVGFAVAMIAAARAWRSPLAPIAIVASLAWRPPLPLGALLDSQLSGGPRFQLFCGLAMLAAQVALLGLYARLEDPAAPGDPVGAERGARRVALVLRLRAALVAASGVVIVVLLAGPPRLWALVVGIVIGLAAIGVVVGQISGLLAMASARLASLSSPGLYIAGFAALWDVLLNTAVIAFHRGRATALLALLPILVGTMGMVVAGWAVHGVAGLRRDRALRGVIANRVAWIIALQIVNAFAVELGQGKRSAHSVGLTLLALAMYASALALLGGLFARIAGRIQVNAATDVF